ncbi:NADH-quinone oxidoreductase subunit NuoE family protein [Phaeacidiphilus oryzae]|uniref:NADH-quinone oxidoreductase subunit NuoE family protein n=1 Tax=Phaeacidiphilus oryzae TaxID=348818 RepID=UPI00055A65BA|nr:NAD(P)H-dependent oxidoreductase subunit E [Phaeacidiphilus oryzae]
MPASRTSDEASARQTSQIREITARHRNRRGALLPILHDVLNALGCVPPSAIPVIAEELNLSRADVHGVVTFYRDFRREPAGRTVVRICRAEACQAVGAEELVRCAGAETGLEPGQTSADGALTVDQVFCLGNCALGPSVQIDGAVRGRMAPAGLRTVLRTAVNS